MLGIFLSVIFVIPGRSSSILPRSFDGDVIANKGQQYGGNKVISSFSGMSRVIWNTEG